MEWITCLMINVDFIIGTITVRSSLSTIRIFSTSYIKVTAIVLTINGSPILTLPSSRNTVSSMSRKDALSFHRVIQISHNDQFLFQVHFHQSHDRWESLLLFEEWSCSNFFSNFLFLVIFHHFLYEQ